MEQKHSRIGSVICGVIFIIVGIGFAGNRFLGWHFNLFFDGWWTLFIIVPFLVNIIGHGVHVGNVFGLGLGILLFLEARDIIDWRLISGLILPAVFILIGLLLIFRRGFPQIQDKGNGYDTEEVPGNAGGQGRFDERTNEWVVGGDTRESGLRKKFRSVLGDRKIAYRDEVFCGAEIECILGSVGLDLRRAVIQGEQSLYISCVLGNVEVLTPQNVNVVVRSSPVFGEVSNQSQPVTLPADGTLVIDASSTFGSVNIR